MKSFPNIIQAVYFRPWSITHEAWMGISRIVKSHLAGTPLPAIRSDGADMFGQMLPVMQIDGDTAIIPIIGPLVQHASLIEKMCGACSYDDVSSNIDRLKEMPGINKVKLVVDSPGGMCSGNIECARKVSELAQWMDVEAVSDSQICSAAYALVAGASRINITPSAMVGSIGAFVAIEDSSKMAEAMGISVDVIKDGELKGAGIPGTSLSKEQREELQKQVSSFAKMFRNHVSSWRMEIMESDMNGACFIGEDALEAGFVDEIIEDLDVEFETGMAETPK